MKPNLYSKQFIGAFMLTLLIAITSISCSNNSKETTGETEEAAVEEHPEALELTSEQMKAVDIVIGTIEEKNLTAVVRASGQLAVPPQNEAQVNVLSGGIIRNIKVMEGEQVRKGQVLATIENQDLIKIQQDYLAARNNFTYTEAEYQRQTQLQAAGAGTGKSFQSAQATYNAEKSRIKAYESQLRQFGLSIKNITGGNIVSQFPLASPIGGTIGNIAIETGSYAQPGTSLMDIVDNSQIHADLVVYEKDLAKIKIGQTVNFQLTNQDNQQIEGKIYGINKSFENDSKGVIVHAVISKPKQNLIPGMYVTGLINIGKELSKVVPVDAVVRSEGKQYIFVVDESPEGEHKNSGKETIHFKKAEVATGVSELGFIQITSLEELPKNTKVVTKGSFYLQSKAAGGSDEH